MSLSLSAAKISVKTALIARPDPSHTVWSRLDPLPTSDDVSESLQARVADPLWMLARQWQFNEFQGEDAGSPISVALAAVGLPFRTLLRDRDSETGVDLPPGAAPLEAMVEHEQVLAVHPKLNAQAGQHLMRRLRAAALPDAATVLLAQFPAPLPAPDDAAADNAGFVWHTLLNARAPLMPWRWRRRSKPCRTARRWKRSPRAWVWPVQTCKPAAACCNTGWAGSMNWL